MSTPIAITDSDPAAVDIHPLQFPALPRIKWSDIGIVPLMLSMPFMYFPRVIDGDTQIWVLLSGLIALFTFRTRTFVFKRDYPLILLSVLCVVTYAVRVSLDFELFRVMYIQLGFIVFWIVARRENGEFFGTTVRITVIVWFLFGFYQFISVAMGYGLGVPDFLAGRYVAGRSGVPGLTAEPSFYGSLSMIQMMYLLSERKAKNRIYIACAAVSVIFSGSLLSVALLVFPLMKFPLRARIAMLVALPAIVAIADRIGTVGLTARFTKFNLQGSLMNVLLDPSLNLRVGHIYFTLYRHFWESVLLISPVHFMNDYNKFAQQSGIFIDTGTNFILTSAGEIIYQSGAAGLLLLLSFIYYAQGQASTRMGKVEKVAFIFACMLNPIALANPFLVIYARQKTGSQ